MVRVLAVSAGVLCATFAFTGAASAHHVEPGGQGIPFASLRDFDTCQQQGQGSEACLDALKAYVKEHPKDALEAGQLVRPYYMHWVALDFFVQALAEKRAQRHHCADEEVGAAVLSGLALPAHYPAVAQAQTLVRDLCPRTLEPLLAAKLKGAGSALLGNACPLLNEQTRPVQCSKLAQETKPAPAPTALDAPAKERLAAVPHVREAPARVQEKPHSTSVQRMEQAFASVPAGEPVSPDAIAELKSLDWRLLNLDTDSAEVLRGAHGEELMLVRTKPGGQDYVLLKFKGIRGPWNEHVLVSIERRSENGRDYVVALEDREAVVMIERQRQYQAFPKGVTGGVWLNPVRPSGEQALKLPTRREIEGEFASATAAAK